MIENKYDWKIHKILDEAKRVYICPARGNGKLYTQLELYADLFTNKKKDISVIRAEDIEKAIDIFRQKAEAVPDFDVIDALERTHRYELFNDYLVRSEPKIIFNTTIIETPFWKERTDWLSLYDGFIVTPEKNEDNE